LPDRLQQPSFQAFEKCPSQLVQLYPKHAGLVAVSSDCLPGRAMYFPHSNLKIGFYSHCIALIARCGFRFPRTNSSTITLVVGTLHLNCVASGTDYLSTARQLGEKYDAALGSRESLPQLSPGPIWRLLTKLTRQGRPRVASGLMRKESKAPKCACQSRSQANMYTDPIKRARAKCCAKFDVD
jgi:hypothetical protein